MSDLAGVLLTTSWSPHDEDDFAYTLEEHGPDAPWDWAQTSADGDGDWPPTQTAYALDLFNDTDPIWDALSTIPGVRQVSTTCDGDYLHLPVEHEQQILQGLQTLGHTVTHAQPLIDPRRME